jgi:hypothetical protein
LATLDERLRKVLTIRVMAVLIAVIAIFLLFRPLFLPMRLMYQTVDFYNRIEALKPGEIVVFSSDMGPGDLLGDRRDIYKAVINHLIEKGVKIIFHPTGADWSAATGMLKTITDLKNLRYGVDYVFLPYAAGEEMAWASFAADIHGFYKTDLYGTPLSELPMMVNVRSMRDVDLCVVQYGIFTWGEMFMRQWPAKYGVDMICLAAFSTLQGWYGTFVKGNLDLDQGFAEYEGLRKVAGEHILKMEVRNVVATLVIALVLVETALFWISRPAKVAPRTVLGV